MLKFIMNDIICGSQHWIGLKFAAKLEMERSYPPNLNPSGQKGIGANRGSNVRTRRRKTLKLLGSKIPRWMRLGLVLLDWQNGAVPILAKVDWRIFPIYWGITLPRLCGKSLLQSAGGEALTFY